MKWTVVWNSQADQALLQMWLESDSATRARISHATTSIDRILAASAQTAGESRQSELQRMLIFDPLGIVFEIQPDDCMANVLSVHLRHRP